MKSSRMAIKEILVRWPLFKFGCLNTHAGRRRTESLVMLGLACLFSNRK